MHTPSQIRITDQRLLTLGMMARCGCRHTEEAGEIVSQQIPHQLEALQLELHELQRLRADQHAQASPENSEKPEGPKPPARKSTKKPT